MTKLLLTSCGFYNETIQQRFLSLIDGDTRTMKAAIITTASPAKEHNRYAMKAYEDLERMGFGSIDFVDVEYDSPDRMAGKDIVYLNGGNPFSLLLHLRNSGADHTLRQLAKQNAIFVGVSAGALVLGPDIKIAQFFTPHMNIAAMNDLTGIALTDTRIFPHYDREDVFPDRDGRSIEARLQQFEVIEKCEVSRLRDDQFIAVTNE